ncbi:hypothetical protein BZG36_02323 [Bifiguratus adelaidae]|uniref:L-serine ammonia-lyase n=1 Tax=Bifiguratus adelaidae TaxID=1938954 RepID=A0A261Y2L9_9FUNG|nr:hypothetical protein BZG36_02323 [Bifiguratus adelaidae]
MDNPRTRSGQAVDNVEALHVDSPLMHSTTLTKKVGWQVYTEYVARFWLIGDDSSNVWLKLDNLQPSGSFKIRGIGYMIQRAMQKDHFTHPQLVSSSGGNAGLAVAYAGRQLDIPVTVVVPKSTSELMKEKIEAEGARVIVHGEAWDEANAYAQKLLENTPESVFLPPFDHPDLWEGHSSIVHELTDQLDKPPDAVLVSVGGGGLLNGIILGLQDVGWSQVPVIAVETHGSNSFQASVVAGKLVTLDKISTIATSLGAKTVSSKSLELSLVHPVVPFAVSDGMAADAVKRFAADHRMLVEAACGASLSVCYSNVIQDIIPTLTIDSNVVVIVCGGSNINIDMIDVYSKKFPNPPIIVRSGSDVFLKLPGSDGSLAEKKIDTTKTPVNLEGYSLTNEEMRIVLDGVRTHENGGPAGPGAPIGEDSQPVTQQELQVKMEMEAQT